MGSGIHAAPPTAYATSRGGKIFAVILFDDSAETAVAFPTWTFRSFRYSDHLSDQVIVATATELALYASNGSGKTSPLVMTSFIDLLSAGNETRDSKQQSHFQQRQK
jgi:hypothetical protein